MQYLLSEEEYSALSVKPPVQATVKFDQALVNYIKRIPNCGEITARRLLDAFQRDRVSLTITGETNWNTQHLTLSTDGSANG
jgi:hypothetical protein